MVEGTNQNNEQRNNLMRHNQRWIDDTNPSVSIQEKKRTLELGLYDHKKHNSFSKYMIVEAIIPLLVFVIIFWLVFYVL